MKVLDVIIAVLNSFWSILSVFAALIFVLFFISYQRQDIEFFDYSPFPITMKAADTCREMKIKLVDNSMVESNSLTVRSVLKAESKNFKYNLVNLLSWCVVLCYAIFTSKVLKALFTDIKNRGDGMALLCAKKLKTLALMTFALFTYNLILVIFFKYYFFHDVMIGNISYDVSLRGINYTVLVLAHVLLFTGYFIKLNERLKNSESQ